DMFDLKADAPSGIRCEFKPIATSAPGVQVCELLPKLSRWMHKAAIVRSVYHNGGCHNNLPMYTRYDVPPPDNDSARTPDPPSMGSVCMYHEQAIQGKKPGILRATSTCRARSAGANTSANPVLAADSSDSATTRSRRNAPPTSITRPTSSGI